MFLTVLWGLALKRLSWVNNNCFTKNTWSDSGIFIPDVSKLMILVWSLYWSLLKKITALTINPLTFHIYAFGFPIFGNRSNCSHSYTLMTVTKMKRINDVPQSTIYYRDYCAKIKALEGQLWLYIDSVHCKVELKYKANLVTVTKTFTQSNKVSNKRVLMVLLLCLLA